MLEPESLRAQVNPYSNFFTNFLKELKAYDIVDKEIENFAKFWNGLDSITFNEFTEFIGNRMVFTDEQLITRQNYDKHYNIIYAGCSETTGRLLSEDDKSCDNEEYVWGNYLARSLDLDYLNVSLGGAGAYSIVSSVLTQIDKNGSPKHLFILFPQLGTRFQVAQDDTLRNLDGHRTNDLFSLCGTVGLNASANYGKKPFNSAHVLGPTLAAAYSVQAIRTVELVAKLAKINLIYSTWSLETQAFITAANKTAEDANQEIPFKNFIENENVYIGNHANSTPTPIAQGCHKELESHKRYNLGRRDHMGVHAHAHLAKIFIEELTKRGYTATL